MTSSEDVLLQVPQVRFKKGDGTLYIMDKRIAWMLENRDSFSIFHLYQDIKSQKISPEGKPKIQLQVVLHSGSSSTFHFVNRDGAKAQAADRDRVKELLQNLLPKFKRKVDKELEEKNKLLSSNPALLQLYKDLVMTEVVTSEEFWAQHASQYMQANKGPQQEIGVSGAFLADIKPQTDGCNGLKYNITADIIECIFKTYPAVRKKYMEHVPAKLSESEFWTKFFQSHYFHRDRINTGNKDIFTECAKLDDQELKKDIQIGIDDPLIDIAGFEDKTLDDGYGNLAEKTPNQNIVHQSMIKRFNQHSIMVLKATKKRPEPAASTDNGSTSQNATPTPNGDEQSTHLITKKQRIQEKISFEDLDSAKEQSHTTSKLPLHLSKIERYLQGPNQAGHSETGPVSDVSAVAKKMQNEIRNWHLRTPSTTLVNPAAAVSALGELSPGGALMKGFQEQSLAQIVPADIEKDLRHLYLGLCELLRHFWLSFPPTTPQLEQKAIRMHEALQRYHAAKLKPFEDKIKRELFHLSQHLTTHLNQLLNAAYSKFNTWQQRKVQMSHR